MKTADQILSEKGGVKDFLIDLKMRKILHDNDFSLLPAIYTSEGVQFTSHKGVDNEDICIFNNGPHGNPEDGMTMVWSNGIWLKAGPWQEKIRATITKLLQRMEQMDADERETRRLAEESLLKAWS